MLLKNLKLRGKSKGIGSIYFRSPGMTSEIYQDPERTAGLFKSGWFDSEDLGTVDEDGYIAIVDRSKDLIKSGGEWISSVDLENIIMAHPAVLEACVVAIHCIRRRENKLCLRSTKVMKAVSILIIT